MGFKPFSDTFAIPPTLNRSTQINRPLLSFYFLFFLFCTQSPRVARPQATLMSQLAVISNLWATDPFGVIITGDSRLFAEAAVESGSWDVSYVSKKSCQTISAKPPFDWRLCDAHTDQCFSFFSSFRTCWTAVQSLPVFYLGFPGFLPSVLADFLLHTRGHQHGASEHQVGRRDPVCCLQAWSKIA